MDGTTLQVHGSQTCCVMIRGRQLFTRADSISLSNRRVCDSVAISVQEVEWDEVEGWEEAGVGRGVFADDTI